MSALAPGLVTPVQLGALVEARAKGILIVLSTRAGSSRVLRRASMLEQGIVAADNLNPQKARILLMLALTLTDDPEEIQDMFNVY